MSRTLVDLAGPMLRHEITPRQAVDAIVAWNALGVLPEPDLTLRVRTRMNLERLADDPVYYREPIEVTTMSGERWWR